MILLSAVIILSIVAIVLSLYTIWTLWDILEDSENWNTDQHS